MVTHFTPKNGYFYGVFAYINSHFYSNFRNYVEIGSSAPFKEDPQLIFPPKNDFHLIISSHDAYYTFTLKNFMLNVTSYSILSSYYDKRAITQWKLEGSKDLQQWTLIHQIQDCFDCAINTIHNYKIKNDVYQSFRLTKLNVNDDIESSKYFFDLFGFELFGTICNPLNCDVIIPKVCTHPLNFKVFNPFLASMLFFIVS